MTTIAKEINNQLRETLGMINYCALGIKSMVYSENSITYKCRKGFYANIVLNGMDLYDICIFKLIKYKKVVKLEKNDIYNTEMPIIINDYINYGKSN